MTEPTTAAGPSEHVYDTRALTDDQRQLADDIASAMGFGHEDGCSVWWDNADGCSCPLIQSVADGLNGANVVEVIQEMGYDPATRRGDRLERRPFRPHPLAEARQPDASVLRTAAERVIDWADHQEPWNPNGDFDALRESLGRRRPLESEPAGLRYYVYGHSAVLPPSAPAAPLHGRIVGPPATLGYECGTADPDCGRSGCPVHLPRRTAPSAPAGPTDTRAEDDIAAYAEWRGDPKRTTADVLAALPPSAPAALDVDALAQIIREEDGNHDLGAGALAERILARLAAQDRSGEPQP